MRDSEKKIIPLDDAHEILSAFGIGPSSREYQRWRREDGFRQVDFESILDESSKILIVDWRDLLQDAVVIMVRQLGEFGIEAEASLNEEGNRGVIRAAGRSARIKYVPADDDDFDQVIAAINGMVGQVAHYRKLRSCEGSDGWSYAILSNENWQALESAASATMRLLFVEL